MREIKFRAWRKEEKRMIYLANNMGSQTHLQLNNHSWGVFEPDSDDYYGIASANSNLGDILMQYTGLKDKNGTEIYEGDIVRFDEELSVVRYDEETARFVLDDYGIRGCLMEYGWDEGAGGIGIIDTNGFDDFNDISEIEVIGNIHENPELLEGRE